MEKCPHGIELQFFCQQCFDLIEDEPAIKYDDGKPRWSLLPWKAVNEIVKVLTYGANKYTDDNWHKVVNTSDGEDRYFSAMMRHLYAWREGEKVDPESKLSHLAHAGCCLIFLLWKEKS